MESTNYCIATTFPKRGIYSEERIWYLEDKEKLESLISEVTFEKVHVRHLDLVRNYEPRYGTTYPIIISSGEQIPDVIDELLRYVSQRKELRFENFSDLRGIEFLGNVKKLELGYLQTTPSLGHLELMHNLELLRLYHLGALGFSEELDLSRMTQLREIYLSGCHVESLELSGMVKGSIIILCDCLIDVMIVSSSCSDEPGTPIINIDSSQVGKIVCRGEPSKEGLITLRKMKIASGTASGIQIPFLETLAENGQVFVEELCLRPYTMVMGEGIDDLRALDERKIRVKHLHISPFSSLQGIALPDLKCLRISVCKLAREDFVCLDQAPRLTEVIIDRFPGTSIERFETISEAFLNWGGPRGFRRVPHPSRIHDYIRKLDTIE